MTLPNIAPAKWYAPCCAESGRLVERTISNGTPQFVYQCPRCKRAMCSPIKRERAYEIAGGPALPRWTA